MCYKQSKRSSWLAEASISANIEIRLHEHRPRDATSAREKPDGKKNSQQRRKNERERRRERKEQNGGERSETCKTADKQRVPFPEGTAVLLLHRATTVTMIGCEDRSEWAAEFVENKIRDVVIVDAHTSGAV